MSTMDNKKTVSTFFEGLFEGKQAIIDNVLSADGGQIKPGSHYLKTLIGEGEHVAAEWTGGFKTIRGLTTRTITTLCSNSKAVRSKRSESTMTLFI